MMLGRNAPDLRRDNLSTLPNGFPGGTTTHIWNSFQFYDDAFLTRGTHSLKFGFAVSAFPPQEDRHEDRIVR